MLPINVDHDEYDIIGMYKYFVCQQDGNNDFKKKKKIKNKKRRENCSLCIKLLLRFNRLCFYLFHSVDYELQ